MIFFFDGLEVFSLTGNFDFLVSDGVSMLEDSCEDTGHFYGLDASSALARGELN